ncbi:hypothetical protein ACRRTK_022224 [Alexandromys fortis]
MGCWNASIAFLDGAWASLAIEEREAMSLCELRFTSLGALLAPHHPATVHLCWLLSTISCALRSARPGTTSFRTGWPCQLCGTFSSHPVA